MCAQTSLSALLSFQCASKPPPSFLCKRSIQCPSSVTIIMKSFIVRYIKSQLPTWTLYSLCMPTTHWMLLSPLRSTWPPKAVCSALWSSCCCPVAVQLSTAQTTSLKSLMTQLWRSDQLRWRIERAFTTNIGHSFFPQAFSLLNHKLYTHSVSHTHTVYIPFMNYFLQILCIFWTIIYLMLSTSILLFCTFLLLASVTASVIILYSFKPVLLLLLSTALCVL